MTMPTICGVCGPLTEGRIMISNGVRVCAEHQSPLMTQAEIDSNNPPHYERSQYGYWERAPEAVEDGNTN